MVKVKRKRKPMTDEQKKAAAERLAKARAAKGPVLNLSIHESIRDLADDHPLSPGKVKQWIKVWKKHLAAVKYLRDSKDPNERRQFFEAENYISNMQTYLTSGVWLDARWGESREFKMFQVCVAPAYRDGVQVRTKGVYYHDIGVVYGEQ